MGASPFLAKERTAQILIVEDDGIIARDISLMLEELGYGVAGIAASGAEAFELAATEHVDLVLMDVRIKGDIDGIETAAQLLRRHRLPVVYLTAHSDDVTLGRATETRPFGYITKPISIDDLKVGVAVALARFRATQQIEDREYSLHQVLENMTEGMLITDERGCITFLNRVAADLIGCENRSCVGQPLDNAFQLLDQEGNEQALEYLGREASAKHPEIRTGTILHPDQTHREVVVSVVPLVSRQGSGSVLVLHDFSEFIERQQNLQETNQQLATSNERLKLLSQTLTHDLREPLRTVTLYSNLLETEEASTLNDEARMMLQTIRKAGERMGTIMSALLEYFSASGLNKKELQWLDASGPFREALMNLDVAIRSSQARIQASDFPKVYAHPTALMLVFQNLIGNAIKYAGRDAPDIHITAEREAKFWRFTVADKGIGFNPEKAKQIFVLFGRAHGSEQSGTGIGLATCQRLIEQQHGTIWAESKVGEGSRFYFTLPTEPR